MQADPETEITFKYIEIVLNALIYGILLAVDEIYLHVDMEYCILASPGDRYMKSTQQFH